MSNHNYTSLSSWKELIPTHQKFSNNHAYSFDSDYVTWQSALRMSQTILDAFGSALPASKEIKTRTDFRHACYEWLTRKPELNYTEEENITCFNDFNFNKSANPAGELLSQVEVLRTANSQLVCRMPEYFTFSKSEMPDNTKGIIVNIAAISYDMWLKKVTHQHRFEYIMNSECSSDKTSNFLLPVATGEHMLTLTVVTFSYWSVINGCLLVAPETQWQPAGIAGSTYN